MRHAVLILLALFVSSPAWAMKPWGKTPTEDAMCRARVAGHDTSDRRNWGHMHHYCDGLRFYNRALSSMRNRNEFNFNIKESLDGFDYVLKHTAPDFHMRPHVTAEKARVLALAGRKIEAVSLYAGVVQQTPNFVPAYLFLADHYANSNRTKALELVSQGLRHNPATKSLQRRYRELGGKLPYPEPLVKADPMVPEPQVTTEPAAAEKESSALSVPTSDAAVEAEPPKIGSPTNPYCRFCVD